MNNTILKQIPELSIWEISHYWHGVSPSQTSPSKLPIEVEKTMRVLAGGASKSLYFRCVENSLYYQAFNDQAWAVRSISAIYQKELKRAYKGIRFKKSFLNSLTITRTAIAKWCKKTNIPAPEFWFDEDDPLLKKNLNELDTMSAISRNGYFKLISLSDSANETSKNTETDASINADALKHLEIPSSEKLVRAEISRLARENALSRHKPLQEIKKRFIRHYYAKQYTNRSLAARDFFDALTFKERISLVPTYDEKALKASLDKAVTTLTKALREYESQKEHAWLRDFSLEG